MLTQMMSAGAMGGGVSSAISRAIGAGDRDRAATLALHAAMIGACGGLLFTVLMLSVRPAFYALLGGRGERAGAGLRLFATCCSAGAIAIWLVNTLASVLRGTGDMKMPSVTLIGAALVQIVVGGALGLGLFGAAATRHGAASPRPGGRLLAAACCFWSGIWSAAAAG